MTIYVLPGPALNDVAFAVTIVHLFRYHYLVVARPVRVPCGVPTHASSRIPAACGDTDTGAKDGDGACPRSSRRTRLYTCDCAANRILRALAGHNCA